MQHGKKIFGAETPTASATQDQVQVCGVPTLLGYGLSCLTDRTGKQKNLLRTANLNSLARRSGKTEQNYSHFLSPVRQHLRLSGHAHLYAPELQKHQEWCYDKFSAAVRTCSSVTGYTPTQSRLFHTMSP